MSNKTQILCNNNIELCKTLRDCWDQLSSHTRTLEKLEKERQDLTKEIIRLKGEKKNSALQMVKLGRVIKEIKFFKYMNQLIHSWIKDRRNKLVIC